MGARGKLRVASTQPLESAASSRSTDVGATYIDRLLQVHIIHSNIMGIFQKYVAGR
jgi:hypothetical protein